MYRDMQHLFLVSDESEISLRSLIRTRMPKMALHRGLITIFTVYFTKDDIQTGIAAMIVFL